MSALLNPSEIWRNNHPWAPIYAFALNRPPIALAGGRLFMGTDIRLLYRAAEAIGETPDGSAILDVPCGGGVALRGLRPDQDVRYVASDIASAMLDRTREEARKRGVDDRVETIVADIAKMPFADGEFDLCVSFTGLHCVPDPHAAVIELGRVVKPGGRITGSLVLTDVPPHRRVGNALGRAAGLMGPSATGPEIAEWLEEAGFTEVRLVRSGPLGYFTGTRR